MRCFSSYYAINRRLHSTSIVTIAPIILIFQPLRISMWLSIQPISANGLNIFQRIGNLHGICCIIHS